MSALLMSWGCRDAPPASEEPAHIQNPVAETDLTTVHLTASAVERIGIEVAQVERRAITRTRSVGAELVAPSGSELIVAAPGTGIVLPPAAGLIPDAGATVSTGQPLMRLAVLDAAELAGPQQALVAADARLENAQAKASRARTLLADGIASRAELEDAVAELRTAEAAADAARARADLLSSGATRVDVSALQPVVITAPRAGQLLAVLVGAGQTVSAGAPLLRVIAVDPLWVKVPVYPGDVELFDRSALAWVESNSGRDEIGLPATPITGPSTANPAATSVDLYYQVANADSQFRPGERVTVRIPMRTGMGPQTVVPWSAVVFDVFGGAWIYEDLGDGSYARRRIEVIDVVDGLAVISRGVAPGIDVVVVGAAELFSTEFGEDSH